MKSFFQHINEEGAPLSIKSIEKIDDAIQDIDVLIRTLDVFDNLADQVLDNNTKLLILKGKLTALTEVGEKILHSRTGNVQSLRSDYERRYKDIQMYMRNNKITSDLSVLVEQIKKQVNIIKENNIQFSTFIL